MASRDQALIVEDSPSIGEYLKTILEGTFDTEVVISAELALFKLQSSSPRVVLLDLHLPGMSGLEFLKTYRSRHKTTAIVVLTGQGSVRVALEALQEGADWFVEKQDFTPEELVQVIWRAIERREGILAQDELAQLRKRFYAAITHDLRSPVGSALMALELLDTAEPGSDDEKAGKSLARVSLERAMHLIERYLDYEKINAGFLELDLKQADLLPLLNAAVLGAEARARAAGQALVFQAPARPVEIKMDSDRLLNVFENILSNALRYTPRGGTVRVSVQEEPGKVSVSIQDTGKGISLADREKIFQPYRRIQGDSTPGTGLGLAISREIAEAHGGTIEIESEGVPGKGSLFRVVLPR